MIQWATIMLPEHVAELQRWKDYDNYTKKPKLNEWIHQLIQEEPELA